MTLTAVRIILRPVWSSLDSESEIIKSYWGTVGDTAEIMTDKDKASHTPPRRAGTQYHTNIL